MHNHSTSQDELEANKKSQISDPRILRSPHDRENPYVMVSKQLINDKSISLDCMALLIFLLSKPADWNIRVSQLISEFSGRIGSRKVYALIKEAIKAGYMKRVDVIDGGLKNGCHYFVSESPIYRDDVKKSLRHGKKRHAENCHDNILSNDSYTKKKIYKEEKPSADPPCSTKNRVRSVERFSPTSTPPTERAKHIVTTDDEHKALVTEHGEEKTQKFYDKLSLWKQDKPKSRWMKNDYRTIKRWVIGAVKEEERKKSNQEETNVEKNKELARSVYEEYYKESKNRGINIIVYSEYIEFTFKNSPNSYNLKYSEHGFKDQLFNMLRKMSFTIKKYGEGDD